MSGSAPGGYDQAVQGAAVRDRSRRRRLTVTGRAPTQMIQGLITNSVPPLLEAAEDGVWTGRAAYAALLTPKGRMVSDLRVLRPGSEEAHGLLLDLPAEGADAARAHMARYIPPRFATVEDVSEATGQLTVVGPAAAGLVAREALGLRVDEAGLERLEEGGLILVGEPGGDHVVAVRTGDVGLPAFDVLADRATVEALRRRLEASGAAALDDEAWEALRVEAGRPAWGADLDDATIPLEAGLGPRAIDHGKGCYTGQEVVVRIRDRGHVNRHLRRLRLGSAEPPPAGSELWVEGGERPVGQVTSAVRSPRAGETLGLGWVRREVEVPGEVRLGGPDGPPVGVEALEA